MDIMDTAARAVRPAAKKNKMGTEEGERAFQCLYTCLSVWELVFVSIFPTLSLVFVNSFVVWNERPWVTTNM